MCTSDEPEEPDPSRRFKMVVEAAYQGKTASPGFAEHGPIRVAFSADGDSARTCLSRDRS